MEETVKKSLNKESIERLKGLEHEYPFKQSVVLSVLHVIYDQFGYLDNAAIEEAAEYMKIPEVYFEEAASFYTMFPLKPRGKYLIQVCQNICCTLMGAEELVDYLKEKLGIDVGETTEDNMFSLVVVECLGACAAAPVMQINDIYYEYLTRAKVDEILETLRNSQ
jgi:NADH-quinone oxidoreductase E subunit